MFYSSCVILVLLSLSSVQLGYSGVYDEMKRDLVITQFRNKLMEQLSDIIVEPQPAGDSHKRKKRHISNRSLNKVHGISLVVEDANPIISKIIIPGFNVSKGQKEKGQSFEFRLPKTISRAMIKSAKLFIYVDNPGLDIWGWRIEVVNSSKMITKNYRILSKAKLQHFIVSDILKAYLGNAARSTERTSLILRLLDHNIFGRMTKIKSIMLMVSVKTAPKRNRRSTLPELQNRCTNTSVFCCLQSFAVSPSRIYLPNLISPDVIHLNYCKGDCNRYIRGKSNYAKALGLLKTSKISPLSARQLESMESCCAPQGYSRIRIKYINDQTQEPAETVIHDMIVSSCGCF